MSLTASLWRTCLDLNLSSVALIIGVFATPGTVLLDVLHAPFVGLAWIIRQFRQGIMNADVNAAVVIGYRGAALAGVEKEAVLLPVRGSPIGDCVNGPRMPRPTRPRTIEDHFSDVAHVH